MNTNPPEDEDNKAELELVEAASQGDTETVTSILDAFPTIRVDRALTMATLNDHLDVLEQLVYSVDPTFVGQHILQIAIFQGNIDIVDYLITNVDMHLEDINAGLSFAVARNKPDIVSYLALSGLGVNLLNALDLAYHLGHMNLVTLLRQILFPYELLPPTEPRRNAKI